MEEVERARDWVEELDSEIRDSTAKDSKVEAPAPSLTLQLS